MCEDDLASEAAVEKATEVVQRFLRLFNGNWNSDKPQHFCCLADRRLPCHVSPAAAIQDMQDCVSDLLVLVIRNKMEDNTKKWGEVARRACLTGFLGVVHNLMRQGSEAWLRKKELGVVQAGRGRGRARGRGRGQIRGRGRGAAAVAQDGAVEDGAAAVAQDGDGDGVRDLSPERAEDDFHTRRKKRERRAAVYWQNEDAVARVLAASVVTVPLRSFLGAVFGVESSSALLASGGVAAEAWYENERKKGVAQSSCTSLAGRLVRDGGAVDVCAEDLDELLKEDSPLGSPVLFKLPAALRGNRSAAMRAGAGHWVRVKAKMQKRNSYWGLVKAFDVNDEDDKMAEYTECVNQESCCDDEWFMGRWKKRRCRSQKAIDFFANTPMVCSIVCCEVQHSHFNNSVKATDWWKVGPTALIEEQLLKQFKGQVPRFLRERLRRKLLKRALKPGATKIRNQWSSAQSSGKVVAKAVGVIRKGLLQSTRQRKSVVSSPANAEVITPARHFAFNAFLNVKLAELDTPHERGQWLPWKQDMAKEFKKLTPKDKEDYMNHPSAKRQSTGAGRRKKHQLEQYQDSQVNEEVDQQSPWKMQSAQRPLARPLFDELVAEHCSSSSLRLMDEEVTRQATAVLGRRASHEFAVRVEDRIPFDRDVIATIRSENRPCDERHHGLCRSVPHFGSAKVFAKNLFDGVREIDETGEALMFFYN